MQDPRILAARDSETSQAEYEAAALALLDEGQVFLAYDLAAQGLRRHPASLKLRELGALSLLETGAVDEAKRVVEPIVERVVVDKTPFRRVYARLRDVVQRLPQEDGDDPSADAVDGIARLAEALDGVLGKRSDAQMDAADAGALDLLGRIYREAWRRSGDRRDLSLACELYQDSFRRRPDYTSGVSAASLAWLLGERALGEELAREVLDLAELRAEAEAFAETALDGDADDAVETAREDRDAELRRCAAVAEAALLVGETEQALDALRREIELAHGRYAVTVATRRQLEALAAGGLEIDPAVFELLKPPAVVVFTGHMLDVPGEGQPRFWPELETAVKAEIAARLERLDARIGYASGACGGDLLFIEAMLERGAEVHIVLPFDQEDFVAACVRYAGARWEMRFRNALKLASSVTYATEEHYLGHDMLFRFGNQVLHGLATLRARFLSTSPYLVALWDCQPGSLIGGAADFIDHWHDIRTLQIIDLDELSASHHRKDAPPAPATRKARRAAGGGRRKAKRERVIRSMLFADLAGFSKLKEEHIPAFLDFVTRLEGEMSRSAPKPESINTWGDAIFAVMPSACDLAEYALRLKDLVPGISGALDGLPAPINVRISLHAGPVFEATDPFSERQNFYGGHINRAARLEPVTVIGHVYATQQFVALLTAEVSARRDAAEANDEPFVDPFVFHYVGVVSLAKNFGQTPVYQLMRA